jgi:GTP-binding protein
VIESLGRRRAIMSNMITVGESRRLEYTMPTRAIFGLRGELLTLSRGTAVMSHTYYDHQPLAGAIPGRSNGALVASDSGVTTEYAMVGLESRGRFFIGPQVEVYEGMIVGRGPTTARRFPRPRKCRSNARSSSSKTTNSWKSRRDQFGSASVS